MELPLGILVNEGLSGRNRASEVRAGVRSGTAAIMAGLAALLLDEVDALDADAALDRLHHVVDGEAGNRYRGERFHLDAGRAGDFHRGPDDAPRQLAVRLDVERDLRQRQRMAKRDQFGRPL